MNLLAAVAIAVTTGVISCVIFWWLQARRIRPVLEWCDSIARYSLAQHGGNRSAVKLVNRARRDAIDVTVLFRLHLPGIVLPDATEIVDLRSRYRPVFERGLGQRFVLRPEHMPEDELRRVGKYFPNDLRIALEAGMPVDLQTMLSLVPGARLEVVALSYDAFSGARGVARRFLSLESYRDGRFCEGCAQTGVIEEEGEDSD